MAPIASFNPEYEPTFTDKIANAVKKNAPYVVGRIIQTIMFGLFRVIQFIKQVILDAFT